MSTTAVGPRYPGSFGGGDWDNLSRLGADDASYATAAVPGGDDHLLDWVYGFSFSSDSIPATAVITELTVAGEWYGSATGFDFYMYAKTDLVGGTQRGGTVESSDKTSATVVSGTYTTNLPTVSELSASSFGVRFSVDIPAEESPTAYLDYITLAAKYYVPATCTTDEASDITGTTATCGGETTDDGSGTIATCGVCWNTSGSPTLANSYTEDDSGIGTFASSLTGLWPSTTYYVRSYATTEDGTAYGNEVSFTTSASASRSLVARPFTTRATAAELAARTGDEIVDWYVEDGVVRAEIRPTDTADIPRDRWYVVSRDTPGATVAIDPAAEDMPDAICVLYRTYGVANVRDGSVRRVYYPATPTSAVERVQLLDLTGQYMSSSDATSYAANLWNRSRGAAMQATITAKGGLKTVDGKFVAAPLISAGDWIDVTDLPGHAPVFITGTTFSRAESVVTITTGSTEQRELVVPGLSALPTALAVYGGDGAYESYDTYSEAGASPAPAKWFFDETLGKSVSFTSQSEWSSYASAHGIADDDPRVSHWDWGG